MNDMKRNFKSDIIGYLEFTTRVKDNEFDENAKILLETVQKTLAYYDNTLEAKNALHKVLFKAWNRREFYHVDFDVPSFERGIQTVEYLQVITALDMKRLTMIQLFNIQPESSVSAIQQLLLHSKNTSFTHDLLISFFKITPNVEMDSAYNYAKLFVTEYLSDHRIEQNTLFILMCEVSDVLDHHHQLLISTKQISNGTISDISDINSIWKKIDKIIDLLGIAITLAYEEKTDFIDKKLLNMVKKMRISEPTIQKYDKQGSFNSLYQLVENILKNESTRDNSYSSSQVRIKPDNRNTILKDWENTTINCTSKEDFHQQAFVVICNHLKMNNFPFQPVDISDIISQNKTEKDYVDNLQRISRLINENRSQSSILAESQLWCISILANKSGLWQSVLKVIVQFMDLWIGLIQESQTGGIFALLIVDQNITYTLYENILKHVRHYNKTRKPVIFNTIKLTCSLLECCLDYHSIHEIQALRNYAFFNGYSEEDITLPTLGSVDFWNISFANEITKIGNQITTYEVIEDSLQMNDDVLTRKINLLSLIWPYKVIQELLLLCVYNKNQYKVIIPILRQLGRLCQLKQQSQSYPLLLAVLKDFFHTRDRKIIEEHMENITQFVKGCCHMEFNFDYPLILVPHTLVERSSLALLDIKEFFHGCIFQNLESFYTLTTSDTDADQRSLNMSIFRTSLTLLYSFFDYVTEQNQTWSTLVCNAKNDGLPIILYSQPETLAKYLTDILYLRHDTRDNVPRGFRLQDWEMALTLLGKLSDIARCTLPSSDEFILFNQFLESLKNYDWKTQLLWYDLSSHIPELKVPILVPDSLFRLTGEMNRLFISDHITRDDPLAGWIYLFDACKLSRTVLDTLLINHEKWMYNLILLWRHPNEDTIIGPSFRQVLHPKLSFSVSTEYPILLVDFVGGLANTFDVRKTLYEYSQSDSVLLNFIKKLSEQGIKQFFQALYIIRLLRDEAECCKVKELEIENVYYISCLIKTLQGLTNWGSLSKVTYFESQPTYGKIKSVLIPVNTSTKNLSNTFQSNPLILDDNINSGTGTATDQSEIITNTYYPLFDENSLSSRALSLLTLCFLCQVCGQFESIETRDIIRRLILQIVEGFADQESQQYFEKLIKQQPKNRVIKWKKATHAKVAMALRPILSEMEEHMLMSYLVSLYDSEKDSILHALNLTSPESHKKKSGPTLLYFS